MATVARPACTFFTKEQNKPGADKVIVLTRSYWQTQYQESPEIIGKEVRIDDEAYKVIGVAPRELEAFDARMKFVVPFESACGGGESARPLRRLYPVVWTSQAGRDGRPGGRRGQGPREALRRRGPATVEGLCGALRHDDERRRGAGATRRAVRPTLLMLQGGVAFVLLIGCVNVANLLAVRANARQSELAIRSALGASRATIARQFLMESLLLTCLGALLGLGVAWGALRMTNYYLAKMLPQSLPASLDWRVLGFAVALAAVVGLVIGLIPVFHILRTNLASVIQSSSRGSSSSRGVRALSSVLVVAQVAVALMLLTGAGLLIHSFAEALKVDTGLEADKRRHRAHRPDAGTSRQRRGRQLDPPAGPLQALKEIPGVTSVALSSATPFQGGLPINALPRERHAAARCAAAGRLPSHCDAGYAETLGLKLVEGRFYQEEDLAPGRRLFVVDQSFARKFFPNGSAIGGRFAFGQRPAKPDEWPVIVGVVKDVPHNGVEEKSGNPFIYQLLQGGRPGGLTLFVRTTRPVGDTVSALREKVRGIDPASPLFDVGGLQNSVDSSFDNRRAVMLLLAAFAGLALFLSALGIYGVLRTTSNDVQAILHGGSSEAVRCQ